MTTWNTIGFADSASPEMTHMIFFHDQSMTVLAGVSLLVLVSMGGLPLGQGFHRQLLDAPGLEQGWVAVPTTVLMFLGFPSMELLYSLDGVGPATVTLKATGNQWFWGYDYSDYSGVNFQSHLSETSPDSGLRLLDVDTRVTLPFQQSVRVLVTSSDVLHSWGVPSLGVKVDAVPGRINQVKFFTERTGVFVGQCVEICGANHSFMPIVVEVVGPKEFLTWTDSFNKQG